MGGDTSCRSVFVCLNGGRKQSCPICDRSTDTYASPYTAHLSTHTFRYATSITPKFQTQPLTNRFYAGLDKKLYRADVVFLSYSAKYLFATSRANPTTLTGYISAFSLDPAGDIIRQLCINPTPTSGGHSNAVSPCPWSDEWLALTDEQEGWVEIYRWKNEGMARVAHCDVKEPGFGMNAIWYD